MRESKLCPGCFLENWSGGPCPGCGYRLDREAFPTALQPGTVLSKYVLGRVLGKPGGFGITYLGFDPVLDRRLAIKELMPRELVARRPDGETLQVQTREDQALFDYTRTSFLNEARLIARLSHPNLVRVLDYFEANGTAYFAMEYYEGETLAEYVQRAGGRLPGDEAVGLVLPLLEALDYIHSRDEPIVHRDVKPSNIYLTGQRTPILLDFGAARVALGQQSRSLSAVLTPGFAPYEQYSTRGDQGPWTDVYGCAATLYFLVTGRMPPEASARLEDPRIEPPIHLAPDLSQVVSDAIVHGLGFKPPDRPQSARAFADLLTGRDARPSATGLPGPAAAATGGPVTELAPARGRTDPATEVAPGTGWDGRGSEAVAGAAGGAAPAVAGAAGGAAPAVATGAGTSTSRRPATATVVAALALLALLVASVAFAAIKLAQRDSPIVMNGTDPVPNGPPGPVPDTIPPDPLPVDDSTGTGDDRRAHQGTATEDAAPDPDLSPSPQPRAPEPPRTVPAPARDAAPPPPARRGEAASGVLVIVYGDETRSAQQAESSLLRSLLRRDGLRALDSQSLAMIRGDQGAVEAAHRGDFAALAALGREHGAEFLVVGDLSTSAVPSVNRFYTGTAEMDLKMYRVSTGMLVDAQSFRIGSGGAQAVLATSEGEARSRAAQQAADAAAEAARLWLNRALR